MNSLFQQARGFRTLSIGLILIAIYGTYALLTGVFLNVERHGNAISRTRPQRQKEAPSDFRKPAELWFREDPWVAEAGKRFRDGQRIVYTQNITLLNDNHAVKVEPVAMLWEQKGETEPVTMTAASARFEASSAMMKDGLSFGRITRGALLGDVRIRGPHGLRIDGHNFNISDDSLRVYSSAPVTFAWEDHTAFAQDGIEIQLVASDEETEKGLVSVNNIQWIRLNGRVECDLMLDNKNPRRESTHIRIDAKNGFEFFVPTQTATFLGPRSQKPTRENQIVVTRPLPTGQTDRLFCTQLTIQLKPEIQPEGVHKETPSRLALDTIRAEGNRTLPVVFQSEQENVIATMTTLTYHVDQQQLELQNTFVDPSGRPFPVRIQQEASELLSPWILVFLGESGSLQSLECRGPGLIRHSEKATTDSLTAAWNESFMFINNSLPKLIFRKNVQIAQPSRKFSLSGELVEVELTGTASAEESGESDAQKPDGSDSGNGQAESAFALGRMKPQRIIARNQVKLVGEQMSGLAREQLTVTFSESPANGSVDATAVSSSQVNGLLGTGAEGSTGFTHFDADTLEATMVVTEGSSGKLSNVWLKGGVSVDHTAVDQEQSFNATGNVLRAETGFQTQRQISLFGEPAVVVSSTRRIEGQRIDIDPEKREVTVEGSGRIRLVADRDFAGRTLRKPSPLDIYWGDRMTFSGRVAKFFGKIRAVMNDGETHDMELTCAGMEIQFAEDVVIRKTDSSQNLEVVPEESKNGKEKRPGIQEIRCESLVKVRIDQLIESQLDAQHEAEFSDLVVNFETGNFAANGPGWIRSTQPDRGNRMKVAPGIMARANTPVRTTENAFVYVETEFIGSLSGNVNDRIMRLKQHVTGVFGPVRELGERINVSTVSTGDLPARTGILRCEELTVAAVSTPVPGETSFTLEAERNARLESNLLSGDADRITYDHVKEQFILRATRESPATVFHRPGARGEVRSLVGQRFEYYPTRDHLVANEISGVQGSL